MLLVASCYFDRCTSIQLGWLLFQWVRIHTAVLRLPGPKPIHFMLPMMAGSASAAFPACLARARAKDCKAFLTHSFKPPLSKGGAGVGVPPPPPVSASTRVEMVTPSAVSMLAMVILCSRNSVRIRSASVVSESDG